MTYSSKCYREHGLHPGVLYGAQHSFLTEQSSTSQRPETHVFDPHGHKVRVRVRPELSHEDPLGVTYPAGHFGTWETKQSVTSSPIPSFCKAGRKILAVFYLPATSRWWRCVQGPGRQTAGAFLWHWSWQNTRRPSGNNVAPIAFVWSWRPTRE